MPKICVPVCVHAAEKLADAITQAARVADIVELRLDCLDENEIERALEFLRQRVNTIEFPMIVTMRSLAQGGHGPDDRERRRRFWSSLKGFRGDYLFDLELDIASDFAAAGAVDPPSFDWGRIICSHHDFKGVPEDLDQIFDRMTATPARILKIAVQANDAMDCLPIFRLLERAQGQGREMIAIAMAQAGIMTRILGPSRGSFLTYGSIDDQSATAPGQVTAQELRELYRIDRIDQQTEIIGIIGKPVGHSLSPHIHNAAFAASDLNAVYIPFEVRDAVQFMRRMAHPKTRELDWKLCGLSVTAPHKTTVMQCLDWIDPAANEIGAVNTIVARDEQLLGYNTDAAGFIVPLHEKFGSLKTARCAIIGAGGAARACLWALRNEDAAVLLFARDPERAKSLAQSFNVECRELANARLGDFDIVVNATPLGTLGDLEDVTPVTADQLRGVRLAYDLVYNPLETQFLRAARAAGCETLSGIEMLLAQAVEQFKLWTGKTPDLEVMRAAALGRLETEIAGTSNRSI